MSYTWITPKTDWTASTYITYSDYNRIRNNLLYLNDKLNEMFPEKSKTLNLGNAKTGYDNNYHASEFNAFEEALVSFTRVGSDVNIGTRKTYKDNCPFIGYQDLNRIESCCLRWKSFEPPIESVTLSPEQIKIKVNETQQLTITVEPSSATYTVTWSSNNTSAATVNSSGLVTGVGSGQFTITAIVKSGGKTFTLTASGTIESNTIGSFFMFNGQKYHYDLVIHGFSTRPAKYVHLLPKYRTTALSAKWGNTWSDYNADYRNSVQNFIDANFTKQMKDQLCYIYLTQLYGYDNGAVYYNTYTGAYFYLPIVTFYGLQMPSNADPSVGAEYDYTTIKSCTESEINGVPLITGTDKGQLVQVRLKNGDNYTMARLLGKNIYSAERDEVLPIRPVFTLNKNNIFLYPTPNDDGSYSIDWTKNSNSIPISNMPLGTVIRDDTGTGRTG